MPKPPRSLTQKLAWILAIKTIFIFLIWFVFVSPHRSHVDETQIAHHFFHESTTQSEGH